MRLLLFNMEVTVIQWPVASKCVKEKRLQEDATMIIHNIPQRKCKHISSLISKQLWMSESVVPSIMPRTEFHKSLTLYGTLTHLHINSVRLCRVPLQSQTTNRARRLTAIRIDFGQCDAVHIRRNVSHILKIGMEVGADRT